MPFMLGITGLLQERPFLVLNPLKNLYITAVFSTHLLSQSNVYLNYDTVVPVRLNQ